MEDEIIREVEATREKIAERHGYDVKKIAAYLREQAKKRHATEADVRSASTPSENAG